jgi:hypothetical protein
VSLLLLLLLYNIKPTDAADVTLMQKATKQLTHVLWCSSTTSGQCQIHQPTELSPKAAAVKEPQDRLVLLAAAVSHPAVAAVVPPAATAADCTSCWAAETAALPSSNYSSSSSSGGSISFHQ